MDSANNSPTVAPSGISSSAPTAEFVGSNDAEIIKETFRVYGSIYLFFFASFCVLRWKLPRLFNIRSWVPELKCQLACTQTYGIISWCWEVFYISDDDLLEHCGMDALCFLRCLRMGAKLGVVGSINSIWLLPLYLTAEDSPETAHLEDPFVRMSLANLPNRSGRFIAPVVSAYIIVIYAMYLVYKEYDWYTMYRHKYLSKRLPRNYAIYVSGIPKKFRSSYALADYFRQCATWKSAVQEAHIAMDIPTLENKVSKRDKLVAQIEHIKALEKKRGYTRKHLTLNFQQGREGVKKVESVRVYMKELEHLNNQIMLAAGQVTRSNHRMRQHLTRSNEEHLGLSGKKRNALAVPPEFTRSNSAPNLKALEMEALDFEQIDEPPNLSRIHGGADIEEGSSGGQHSLPINDDIFISPSSSPIGDQESPSMTKSKKKIKREKKGSSSQSTLRAIFGLNATSPDSPYFGRTRTLQSEGTMQSKDSFETNPTKSISDLDLDPSKSSSESDIELIVDDTGVKTRASPRSRASWVVGETIRSNAVTVGAEAYYKVKRAGQAGAQTVWAAGSMGVTGVRRAADFGIQKAPEFGASLAATAASVVPMRLTRSDGHAREAGFVVFKDLYSSQAARQMLQHPDSDKMVAEPAPDPEEVFWRNVGLPADARRTGWLLSLAATSVLCFFWSIPVAFLSSLTEVNSLKENLPLLSKWFHSVPALEGFMELIAPVVLLILNEFFLPIILKWFATWEGHVGASVLEASLFVKLCAFVFIQTFFISALSGTITAELSNILANPEDIVSILANSLPAQSSYFMQICFVFTFLLQGFDLIRAYPLTLAFFRRFVFGPRLTDKERRKTWRWFNSLEDPPEFWHAEILAQIMLFFVVFFVYCTIAPITSIFLTFCFVVCESGYRYHFVHNHKSTPDSGGKLWQGFIHVLMASMLIGECTLFGLLILKGTIYAIPALAPLGILTLLFIIFVVPRRNNVATNLPTLLCVQHDKKNSDHGDHVDFGTNTYLQPALRAEPLYPEGEEPAVSRTIQRNESM